MANIELTPELADALRERLIREYSNVCVANFALDILVEGLREEVHRQIAYISALKDRIAAQDEIIERQKIDLGGRGANAKSELLNKRKVERTGPDDTNTD